MGNSTALMLAMAKYYSIFGAFSITHQKLIKPINQLRLITQSNGPFIMCAGGKGTIGSLKQREVLGNNLDPVENTVGTSKRN